MEGGLLPNYSETALIVPPPSLAIIGPPDNQSHIKIPKEAPLLASRLALLLASRIGAIRGLIRAEALEEAQASDPWIITP
jgi:hypothetical protein